MQDPTLSCTKCGTQMEAGFLLDESHGKALPSRWIEGAPVRSIWTGLKLRGRRHVPVTTYRCPSCGYLESYARAGPTESSTSR